MIYDKLATQADQDSWERRKVQQAEHNRWYEYKYNCWWVIQSSSGFLPSSERAFGRQQGGSLLVIQTDQIDSMIISRFLCDNHQPRIFISYCNLPHSSQALRRRFVAL